MVLGGGQQPGLLASLEPDFGVLGGVLLLRVCRVPSGDVLLAGVWDVADGLPSLKPGAGEWICSIPVSYSILRGLWLFTNSRCPLVSLPGEAWALVPMA